MNINTLNYVERFGETLHSDDSLEADVREHHEMLLQAGVDLDPDHQWLLIPEGPELPGAMQVWSKTAENTWVWIDILGMATFRENPLIEIDL